MRVATCPGSSLFGCAVDKESLRELALFAGAGGGILGGHLLGWSCVCAVEIDDYPRRVLLARQRDGCLPRFPIWDDVTTFDGTVWRGRVDVVSGGFPCQDISAAGKGAGIRGERSGLWAEFARIIGEVQPRFVLVENSPMLVARGIDVVFGDLAALGYDAKWGVFSALQLGFPIERQRLFAVANKIMGPERPGVVEQYGQPANVSNRCPDFPNDSQGRWVEVASEFRRMDHGMAHSVERTISIGNGQVPAVVRFAWHTLTSRALPAVDVETSRQPEGSSDSSSSEKLPLGAGPRAVRA